MIIKKWVLKILQRKWKKNNFPFPLKKTIANKKVSSKNKKGGNPSIIEPIGSIDELKDPKKRLAIRNFINNECVNKLENQKLITSSILNKLDKLDKLDKDELDELDKLDKDELDKLKDEINFIISISKIYDFFNKLNQSSVITDPQSPISKEQKKNGLKSSDRHIKSHTDSELLVNEIFTQINNFLPERLKSNHLKSIFHQEKVKKMYYSIINAVKITKDGSIQKTGLCINSIYELAETLDKLNNKSIERNYKFIIIIALKILLYGKNTATQITTNTKLIIGEKKDIYDRFFDIIKEQFERKKGAFDGLSPQRITDLKKQFQKGFKKDTLESLESLNVFYKEELDTVVSINGLLEENKILYRKLNFFEFYTLYKDEDAFFNFRIQELRREITSHLNKRPISSIVPKHKDVTAIGYFDPIKVLKAIIKRKLEEEQELITEELITAELRRYNIKSTKSSDIDEEYFSEISFYGLILDIEYKRRISKTLVSSNEKPLNYYMYKIMKAIEKLQRKNKIIQKK